MSKLIAGNYLENQMKTLGNWALLSWMTMGLILNIGCGGPDKGGPIAPVFGVLLLDGTPFPGVEIVFSPIGVEGNVNPGPYSFGTTDAQGKFELKTRYGDEGAVIARHLVSFQYPDLESGAMDVLRAELQEAKDAVKTVDEELSAEDAENAAAAIQAQINATNEKLKGRRMIPATADREMKVPESGLPDLKIELVSDEK